MALPEFTGELETVWRLVAEEDPAAVPERVTRALLDAEAQGDPEREPSADLELVAAPVAVPNDTVAAAVLDPLLVTEPVAAPDVVTQPDALVLSDGNGDWDALTDLDTLAEPDADPDSAEDLLADADRQEDFVAVAVSTGVDV